MPLPTEDQAATLEAVQGEGINREYDDRSADLRLLQGNCLQALVLPWVREGYLRGLRLRARLLNGRLEGDGVKLIKKNCNNCVALREGHIITRATPRYSCALGYDVKMVEHRMNPEIGNGRVMLPTPAEGCPKPLTWAKYMDAPLKTEA